MRWFFKSTLALPQHRGVLSAGTTIAGISARGVSDLSVISLRGAGWLGNHSRDVACKERREAGHEHPVAHHHRGLRLGRHRSLLAKMAKAKPRRKASPTRPCRRKRLRLTRSREKMDSNAARGFAPHPSNAGCGGAIRQSSVDAADVDRSGQRDVSRERQSFRSSTAGSICRRCLRCSWSTFGFRKISDSFNTRALTGRRWTSH